VLLPWEQAGKPYVDSWSCTWQTTDDGITGSVSGHPLADWDALRSFTPPDPDRANGMGRVDWRRIREEIASIRQKGQYPVGSLEHGHAFLRLSYLRGYERLLYDMADGDHRLRWLIEMVETFSLGIVQRYVDMGVAMMRYPEDLGMQRGPMLAPRHFREYIKPVYERLMAPARQAGCLVHMHSDGDIRDLADDLVVSGVDALNLQDLVNGVDWIANRLKGRICIDLDIDRQSVTRFGTPAQIDALVREEAQKLGSPAGGLMMIYGLYPGVPLENVKALMDALERYATFYA
jgi:uroporphyrinogen-III decarboxylase